MSCLYILELNTLSVVLFADIFSYSCFLSSFHLVYGSFCYAKALKLK